MGQLKETENAFIRISGRPVARRRRYFSVYTYHYHTFIYHRFDSFQYMDTLFDYQGVLVRNLRSYGATWRPAYTEQSIFVQR